jgi:DNA-binding transcriptional ArsR family regulator
MANAKKIFEALGDSTRQAIFEKLKDGPLAVVDIAKKLPVTRPAVSQHLKVLREAGLISSRSEGTRNVYQIDPEGVLAMRRYLDTLWDAALSSFKAVAEAEERKKSK